MTEHAQIRQIMMTGQTRNLLRKLEPPVRPGGMPGPSYAQTRPLLEQESFGAMMALVSSGTVGGSRRVTCSCDLIPDLTEEQYGRLAAAADRAEAAGATTALMLMDGRGLTMDVEHRSVVAELTPRTPEGVIKDIDAAVFVTGGDESTPEAESAPVHQLLPTAILPPAITRQLEEAGVFDHGTSTEESTSTRRPGH